MSDVLSKAEIESRFNSEWVLVEDPVTDEWLQVQSGKVLWHSKDRDEVYRKAAELRPGSSAVLYTGPVVEDEDTAIIFFSVAVASRCPVSAARGPGVWCSGRASGCQPSPAWRG
jgi:hypothetical protein